MTQDIATTQATTSPAAPRGEYRAICFDLDGTLLPMDLDEFLACYYRALDEHMAQAGVNVEEFNAALNAGIRVMMSHDFHESNSEAFWSHFFTQVDEGARDWQALFMDFYLNKFKNIGEDIKPNPAAAEAVAVLREKGYPLVLATMPLFPREAVAWRLAWADVDPEAFARITTYDNSRAVKPQSFYYAEQLTALGVNGSDVLMVGNNALEDLSFAKLGADTFLVTDCLLNPEDMDISTTRHGTLEDFVAWAKALPICMNPTTQIDDGLMDSEAVQEVMVVNERAAL